MRKLRIAERENSSQEFRVRIVEVGPNAAGMEPRTLKEALECLHRTYEPTRKVKRTEARGA